MAKSARNIQNISTERNMSLRPPKAPWMSEEEYLKLYGSIEDDSTSKVQETKLNTKEEQKKEDVVEESEQDADQEKETATPQFRIYKRRHLPYDLEEKKKKQRLQKIREEQLKRHEIEMTANRVMNVDQIVRQHYNERTFIAKKVKRHLSPIIKLRNFNNAIKYMLIDKLAYSQRRCGSRIRLRKRW